MQKYFCQVKVIRFYGNTSTPSLYGHLLSLLVGGVGCLLLIWVQVKTSDHSGNRCSATRISLSHLLLSLQILPWYTRDKSWGFCWTCVPRVHLNIENINFCWLENILEFVQKFVFLGGWKHLQPRVVLRLTNGKSIFW